MIKKGVTKGNGQFYTVTFRAFTNTTCNQLYVDHNFNAAHHSQAQRVPAMMMVRDEKLKKKLGKLSPGTKIEIKCGWDPLVAGDALLDLKVPKAK